MDNFKARPDQIQLDYQGHTSARDTADNAKHRLFKSVDESLLSGDTYTKLVALYDNYITETGEAEVNTAQVKNGEISGMHNWIRLYYLERNSSSAFDYKGFLVKRFNIFSALKYSYGRYIKRSGSFFIGTSPEFDISVYTFCFLFRRGRDTCDFELDGCPISITAFDLIQQKKVFIGSIYPSAGRMTEQCRRLNS